MNAAYIYIVNKIISLKVFGFLTLVKEITPTKRFIHGFQSSLYCTILFPGKMIEQERGSREKGDTDEIGTDASS